MTDTATEPVTFAEGDIVRITGNHIFGGRTYTLEATEGSIGVVEYIRDTYVSVRWQSHPDGFTRRPGASSHVDKACLVKHEVFEVGQQVRVIAPHTVNGSSYTRECTVGSIGTVHAAAGADGTLSVRWNSHPGGFVGSTSSTIDQTCLTRHEGDSPNPETPEWVTERAPMTRVGDLVQVLSRADSQGDGTPVEERWVGRYGKVVEVDGRDDDHDLPIKVESSNGSDPQWVGHYRVIGPVARVGQRIIVDEWWNDRGFPTGVEYEVDYTGVERMYSDGKTSVLHNGRPGYHVTKWHLPEATSEDERPLAVGDQVRVVEFHPGATQRFMDWINSLPYVTLTAIEDGSPFIGVTREQYRSTTLSLTNRERLRVMRVERYAAEDNTPTSPPVTQGQWVRAKSSRNKHGDEVYVHDQATTSPGKVTFYDEARNLPVSADFLFANGAIVTQAVGDYEVIEPVDPFTEALSVGDEVMLARQHRWQGSIYGEGGRNDWGRVTDVEGQTVRIEWVVNSAYPHRVGTASRIDRNCLVKRHHVREGRVPLDTQVAVMDFVDNPTGAIIWGSTGSVVDVRSRDEHWEVQVRLGSGERVWVTKVAMLQSPFWAVTETPVTETPVTPASPEVNEWAERIKGAIQDIANEADTRGWCEEYERGFESKFGFRPERGDGGPRERHWHVSVRLETEVEITDYIDGDSIFASSVDDVEIDTTYVTVSAVADVLCIDSVEEPDRDDIANALDNEGYSYGTFDVIDIEEGD